MAIEKDIAIHSRQGVGNCVSYIDDPDKCALEEEHDMSIDAVLNYSQNEEKTTLGDTESILTSGINCSPHSASIDFGNSAKLYWDKLQNGVRRGSGGTKLIRNWKTGEERRVHKESVEAYHVIQSFPVVEDLDPQLVHDIGIQYAKAAFPNHQCVVSTHMNTDNLHNHIVVCAYEMDGSRKLAMTNRFRKQIRHINDRLSIEHGLPILLDHENRHMLTHGMGEVHAQKQIKTFKEELREDIDRALNKDYVTSWTEFIIQMKVLGYDVRETSSSVSYSKKYIDKEGVERSHRSRDSRLGDKYMRTVICEERGWEYPNEKEQTNYIGHLNRSYGREYSVRDDITKSPETGRLHLHVDRYDEEGRRRTMLEITIIAAIKIIKYFWERHMSNPEICHEAEGSKASNLDPNDKLTMMLEGLELARTLNIENRAQLKERKSEVGKQISILTKELSVLEAKVITATKECDAAKTSGDPVRQEEAYKNMHDLSKQFASLRYKLNSFKSEYMLISKLEKAITLAKNREFTLSPMSSPGEYPRSSVIEEPRVHKKGIPDHKQEKEQEKTPAYSRDSSKTDELSPDRHEATPRKNPLDIEHSRR